MMEVSDFCGGFLKEESDTFIFNLEMQKIKHIYELILLPEIMSFE